MSHWKRFPLKAWPVTLLLSLLILAVACGAAATAVPAAKPAAPPPAAGAKATPGAVPAPVAAPAAPVVNPGKLTWMIAAWGPGRFDSVINGGSGGNAYARILHGFLIAADENANMIPGIAADWSISGDGLTWIVNIRDGVKFHNGSDLTAADVAWTWAHEFSPGALAYTKSSTATAQANITQKVEQTGPKQVSATLKEVYSGFPVGILAEAGPNWIGHILPQRPTLHDEALETAYDKNPVGAGPMKIVRSIPAEVTEFERFEDFYYQPKNGLPEDRRTKFKSLALRLVPEEATRVAALRTGEADIAPASLATKKQIESGGGRLVFGREGVYIRVQLHGCFPPPNPQFPCADKRVRQALDYAINKDLIRDKLYGSAEVFQAKGWAHITPGSIGYGPELDPFPYNPAKARELLAAAGYKTPTNPTGKDFGKLIVNTWVSAAIPFLPEGAQLSADSWRRELGIDAEVKVGESAGINAARRNGDLDGQIVWRDNEARVDGTSITLSSYGTPKARDRMHDSPELFTLVKAGLAVTDPKQQPPALNQLYRRLRDETHELGIGYTNIPWGVGPRVQSWQPFAFAFYPSGLHNIVLK